MTEHVPSSQVSTGQNLPKSMAILGVLLALGMSFAAFVLGVQAKHAVGGKQNISVKGLAEKPVQADSAEWSVAVVVNKPTEQEALDANNAEMIILKQYLRTHGFDEKSWTENMVSIEPHFDEIPARSANLSPTRVQNGYDASQSLVIKTKVLTNLQKAYMGFGQFERDQKHLVYASAPSYLLSTLEDVKMSLIADATKNARRRAEEFVKNDNAKVGGMRSATQGAFYILPDTGDNDEMGDYGGAYDKSTINKIARVVVTVDYSIDH